MKNLKNLIFFLFITAQVGLAQTNTIPSETNIPAQTEAQSNNKIFTPAELLAKYKITDIKTASLEQLQAALTEVRAIIKNLLPTDQASKDSLIPLRIDLKIAIENIEQQAQVNATIQQLRLENEQNIEIKKTEHQQLEQKLAALDKSLNQVKQELAALDKSNNQVKQELAAKKIEDQQIKQEIAAKKIEDQQIKQELAAKKIEHQQIKQEIAAKKIEVDILKQKVELAKAIVKSFTIKP
jgi:chromosome segregation ATPase